MSDGETIRAELPQRPPGGRKARAGTKYRGPLPDLLTERSVPADKLQADG